MKYSSFNPPISVKFLEIISKMFNHVPLYKDKQIEICIPIFKNKLKCQQTSKEKGSIQTITNLTM